MKVKVEFLGILGKYTGVGRLYFDLPEGARYSDLLLEIGHAYNQSLPEQLWDQDCESSNPPLMAMTDNRRLSDPTEPLIDGQQIKFFLLLAGD